VAPALYGQESAAVPAGCEPGALDLLAVLMMGGGAKVPGRERRRANAYAQDVPGAAVQQQSPKLNHSTKQEDRAGLT